MSSSEKTARINARELAERIVALAKIRGISLRELARRSEFENEGHVGTLVSRGRKNPDYGPDVNILRKIAKGGQVHFEWLISGEGERDLPGDVDAPPLTFPWTGAERRIGDAVRASFDPQRHRPSDTHVLKIMLVAMGLPLAVLDQPTLASLVRVWLDAAARTRVFGPATIVTYTLGLEAVDARRVAADYWSRMKHLDRLAAQMEDLFDDVTDPAASLGENDRARARRMGRRVALPRFEHGRAHVLRRGRRVDAPGQPIERHSQHIRPRDSNRERRVRLCLRQETRGERYGVPCESIEFPQGEVIRKNDGFGETVPKQRGEHGGAGRWSRFLHGDTRTHGAGHGHPLTRSVPSLRVS